MLSRLFKFLQKKELAYLTKESNGLKDLQVELERVQDQVKESVIDMYPIGGLCGIYSGKDEPNMVVVGWIFDGTIPLIQLANLNPRAKNAFTVTNHPCTEVKCHGLHHMNGNMNAIKESLL
jgi:hypothetical protein